MNITFKLKYSILLIEMGNRIKNYRMKKGLSQVKLAMDCEMEKSSMSKIEAGLVNVSYLTLYRLSECLEIPMRDLCPIPDPTTPMLSSL